jgi:hypothetical protein
MDGKTELTLDITDYEKSFSHYSKDLTAYQLDQVEVVELQKQLRADDKTLVVCFIIRPLYQIQPEVIINVLPLGPPYLERHNGNGHGAIFTRLSSIALERC